MRAALATLALGVAVVGCGGSSPSAPTPPSAAAWTLSGTVTSAATGAIIGATVRILDGPNANAQTVTDAGGRYWFANLQQAGFTVQASANGFATVTRGVTLTTNTTADFQLPRNALAILTSEGSVGYGAALPDGSLPMHATGVNTGDGCATNVAGTTTIRNQAGDFTRAYEWALNPATVIRAGARFQYDFGPLSAADLTSFGSAGTYSAAYRFVSTACP